MSTNNVDYQFRQISCQRAVNGASFPLGVQDFNFSVGRPYGFIPSRSYFRIALTLTGEAGQPAVNEQLAFADSVCGNLFNNIYFRAGGQDVSSIVNYVPQAQQVKNRLDKSGAWLNTIGKDSFGCEADYQTRINNTSSEDVIINPTEKTQLIGLGNGGNRQTATVRVVAADGRITGTNTLLFTGDSKLNLDDRIMVNGNIYTVSSPATNDVGAGCVLDPFPVALGLGDIADTVDAFKIVRENNGDGRNTVYLMWQPPIGIWDESTPLGSGDYRIQLNPNANYKTACVQGSGVAGAVYDFAVDDVQLFIATVKVDIPTTGVDTLHLMEMQVQSKGFSGADQILDFTVPPSTKAISVFVQSGDAGSNIQIPPSTFKTKDQSDEKLQSIQITYANTTKPSTRWTSEFTPTINYLKQRYTDTQLYSGKFWDSGGSEGFGDWLKRGPLMHYSFVRDQDDRSTHVQLSATYTGGLEAGANLFVVSHYTRAIQISTTNGFISSVESLAV